MSDDFDRDMLFEQVDVGRRALGTLQTEERLQDNLCARCKHGVVMQRGHGELTSICTKTGARVPSDLVRCSAFSQRGHEMNLYDMSQIALMVDTRESGGQYL